MMSRPITRRRLLLGGGAAALAAAGAACSTGSNRGTSSQSSPSAVATQDTAPVNLVLWHSMSGVNGDAINAAIKGFN
jgi:ABC-type glycerol-3-phosphate transport system substrate-binding protein